MDNTTLHTFLFHCPAALRSIVLLGSWDNFTRPYPLELDVRGGRNIWKGCFTFSDIICDGDVSQPSFKRDGPLKMGGTYWYYYKVDGDEEYHNPAEESTTFCPLLPGQRLNVLDVPTESHSRSRSEMTAAFTRNPKDRYLTPVPPAPQRPGTSSRKGDFQDSHTNLLPPSWTPRSATHAPTQGFLSPNIVRHARSASASPCMPSTPIFPDFKSLKGKLVSKRCGSRNRSGSKSRDLDISSPVLVSGGEDLKLVPLSVYRPSVESIRETQSDTTPARTMSTIKREFSPLASHPVDPDLDSAFGPVELPAMEERSMRRRRSHVPSTIVTSEFKLEQLRIRANSADTRRTRHYLFSNDPWLSSPKYAQEPEKEDRVVEDDTPSAPVLSRPSSSLGAPVSSQRPTSSHGNRRNTTFRQSLLDKELPALPRYLVPAPLYACNRTTNSDSSTEDSEDEFQEAQDDECLDYASVHVSEKARSHFSTWSDDSVACSPPTFDDEIVQSPTFSSLTSDDSDSVADQGLMIRYSYAESEHADDFKSMSHTPDIQNVTDDEEEDSDFHYRLSTPPQLNELRISTFGSDLFQSTPPQSPDVSSPRSSRRQAACFGLGFQYSLPEDDTKSKSTLTENDMHAEQLSRTVSVHRESTMTQLNALMEDFAFLGDAVN